ncbi:MAG TPA: hypothetical protein VK670_08625, partial [Silvibacterium sp.]|nr:hypothetical protein [Silvibacterium sp.]
MDCPKYMPSLTGLGALWFSFPGIAMPGYRLFCPSGLGLFCCRCLQPTEELFFKASAAEMRMYLKRRALTKPLPGKYLCKLQPGASTQSFAALLLPSSINLLVCLFLLIDDLPLALLDLADQ